MDDNFQYDNYANASDSVRDVLLSCEKCDQFFHLFCIGHATNPFRS